VYQEIKTLYAKISSGAGFGNSNKEYAGESDTSAGMGGRLV